MGAFQAGEWNVSVTVRNALSSQTFNKQVTLAQSFEPFNRVDGNADGTCGTQKKDYTFTYTTPR